MKKTKTFFQGFHKGMKDFGNVISAIINTLLLLVVYLIGVGLTSFTAKLFGKHFFDKKPSKEKKSYWEDLNLKKKPLEEYYRQF